jgi:hypothetical protein
VLSSAFKCFQVISRLFHGPSSFILHPSSFILHPSSFILHDSRFMIRKATRAWITFPPFHLSVTFFLPPCLLFFSSLARPFGPQVDTFILPCYSTDMECSGRALNRNNRGASKCRGARQSRGKVQGLGLSRASERFAMRSFLKYGTWAR